MKIVKDLISVSAMFVGMGLSSPAVADAGQAPPNCDRDDAGSVRRQQLLSQIPDGAPHTAPMQDKAAARYFVSPQGDDRWSGRNPAASAGSTDGPFATIERARDAIRADKKNDPERKGGVIYLRGGRYVLTRPIVFTADDAGTRIEAFSGETPELAGATSVTATRDTPRGPFTAALSSAPGRDIFIDGVRQLLAYKPGRNGGWRPANPFAAPNAFAFRQGDLAAADVTPDTLVELFDTGRSFTTATRIKSIDTARNVALVAPSDRGPVADVGSFRLLGNPSWAGKTGYFAWNSRDGRLAANPGTAAGSTRAVVDIPLLSSLIIFRNAAGNTVKGLRLIETATVPESEIDSAAIVLDHSFDITLAGNDFRNVGEAVRLTGASRNILRDNVVAETGSTGIQMQDGSDRNLVSGNKLSGIGRIAKSAAAIYLHGSSFNRISRNDVSDVSRHGIGIDNWDDHTINIGNVVEYNKVLKTSRDTDDTGAIEMLGRSRADTMSVIRYNDIRDTGMAAGLRKVLAAGIYLDDLTSGVLVCGNRISGAPLAAIQVHGGSDVTIRDNVVQLDRPGASFVFFQGAPPRSGGHRYDFSWSAPAEHGPTRHLEIRFDNDAVIDGEDRDLFVSKVAVGGREILPDQFNGRYSVDNGQVLGGQVALPWNGAESWDVPAAFFDAAQPVPISVFAWSRPAGGVGAHFIVSVDGRRIGDAIAEPPPDEMQGNSVTQNIIRATAPGDIYYKDDRGGMPLVTGNRYDDLTGTRRLNASRITDSKPVDNMSKTGTPPGDTRARTSPLKPASFGLPSRGGLALQDRGRPSASREVHLERE